MNPLLKKLLYLIASGSIIIFRYQVANALRFLNVADLESWILSRVKPFSKVVEIVLFNRMYVLSLIFV